MNTKVFSLELSIFPKEGGMNILGVGYSFHHRLQFCNLKIWPEHLTFNFLILFKVSVFSLQY